MSLFGLKIEPKLDFCMAAIRFTVAEKVRDQRSRYIFKSRHIHNFVVKGATITLYCLRMKAFWKNLVVIDVTTSTSKRKPAHNIIKNRIVSD